MDDKYLWVPFYMELADKILEYKDNRKELIFKIIEAFDNMGMKLPKLEEDGYPYDIDPFTVFALFNKRIKAETRSDILKQFKVIFSIKSEVPMDFPGIPVLQPMSSTFYGFKNERGLNDINNLWEIFEFAIKLSENPTNDIEQLFIKSYDKLLKQKYIKWNLTMGLYWIRPYNFINLDSTNREFLSNPSNISVELANLIRNLKNPPSAKKYLKICDDCKNELNTGKYNYKTFYELSYEADNNRTTKTDLPDSGIGDPDANTIRYWLYAPGEKANKWDKFYEEGIMGLGWYELGDLTQYNNRTEIRNDLRKIYNSTSTFPNDTRALWQFTYEMKKGDVIFVKRGIHEILGYGIVESDYFYDTNMDDNYPHLRKVKWLDKGDYKYDGNLIIKTLTDFTPYPETVETIKNLFEDYNESYELEEELISYSKEDFLNEVFLNEQEYDTLEYLLKHNKNIILQGPPGVGKTYISKRLAYSLIGYKDTDKVKLIQFHQSYSYEDFIMGFRPTNDGFKLKNGIFYNFCKDAEDDDENDYYFIIDEINRGNISKIFGELFMLIENDKRGPKNKVQLLYDKEYFFIPRNVHIIGLMNTADRSLAILDYALRRRFDFYDIKPAFNNDDFKEYVNDINDSRLNDVIKVIKELNNDIKLDETLGEDYQIGHSYFTNLTEKDLEENRVSHIINFKIIPLLREYWFDEDSKIEYWSNKLRSVI